jgi:DNA polymerase-3 subunit beta
MPKMKITVTTENLLSGLRRVMNVITSNLANPIMNNFLLEADQEKLMITGVDMAMRNSTDVQAMVFTPGKITLPGRKFYQIISALPSGDINMETSPDDPETVLLSCQKSFYKINGLSASGYPETEELVEDWSFSLPVKELVSALSKVSYARSEDESRVALNGVLLSVRAGMMTVAATDGRRLALVEKVLPEGEDPGREGDVIVPYKTVQELMKSLALDQTVKINLTASTAVFETEDTSIVTKLTDGVYPNYRSVIPDNFSQKVAMPRVEFADVLNRVSLVLSNSSSAINFDISTSEMMVWAKSREYGEAKEPIDVSLDGQPLSISFNPEYFLEPLKYLECDQLIMKFNDNSTPVALCGDEGFLYILMPMRNV